MDACNPREKASEEVSKSSVKFTGTFSIRSSSSSKQIHPPFEGNLSV